MQNNKNVFSKKLSSAYLSSLCLELSIIIKSGFPVSEGFRILAETDSFGGAKSDFFGALCKQTEMGVPLFKAMTSAGLFPQYMLNMVEIGEQTGRLDDVFASLSEYYERQERLNSTIKSAVVYPAVLTFLMLVVLTVLITQVLPIFNQVFNQLGAQMSAPAIALMNFGTVLSRHAVGIILALIFAVALVLIFRKPLFNRSKLGQRLAAVRFATALSMTTASGTDTDKALEMASNLVCNPVMAKRIDECRAEAQRDGSLYTAVIKSKIFPALYGSMLSIAFKTGTLETVISEIARRSEDSFNDDIDAVIGHIEPAIVIIMSLLVGLILLSVMLPLMSIMTSI